MFESGLSIGCCCFIYIAIMITSMVLFGEAYSTVNVGQFAILQNKFSKTFDSEIYYSGRYYTGVAKKFITYPLLFQTVIFSATKPDADSGPISSTTSSGSTISISCLVQYVIRPERIFELYIKWPSTDRLKSDLKASIKQVVSSLINQYRPEDFRLRRSEINTRMSFSIGQAMKNTFYCDLNIFTISQVNLQNSDLNAFLQAQLTNKATLLQQQTNIVNEVLANITTVTSNAASQISTINSATVSQAQTARLGFISTADKDFIDSVATNLGLLKTAFATAAGGVVASTDTDFTNFMYLLNLITDRNASVSKFGFD